MTSVWTIYQKQENNKFTEAKNTWCTCVLMKDLLKILLLNNPTSDVPRRIFYVCLPKNFSKI